MLYGVRMPPTINGVANCLGSGYTVIIKGLPLIFTCTSLIIFFVVLDISYALGLSR